MDPLNSYMGPTGGVPPAMPMAGVHSATPVIPKLYWDSYDDEQRIKLLWKCFGQLAELVNQLGYYYVPNFAGEWDATKQYPPLTVVSAPAGLEPDVVEGDSYTSIKWVPVGTPLTDTEYWALTGNYNAQVAALRQALADEATNRVNADNALQAQIDNLPTVFSQRYAEAYGCVPNDPQVDNASAILTAIENNAYFNPSNTYYFNGTINITKRQVYDFCGSNFVYTGTTTAFNVILDLSYTKFMIFKNLNISCNHTANSVINVGQSGPDNTNKCVFDNIMIETDFDGIGFNIQSGYENSYVNCSMYASEQAVNETTMFYVNKTDCVFDRCVSRNVKRFVYDAAGNNNYNNCHPWISPSIDITGTVAFDIADLIKVSHVIIDNVQTGFKLSSGASLFGSATFVFVANSTDTYTYDADDMEIRRASNLFLEKYNPQPYNHMFKTKQWVDAYGKRTYYSSNTNIVRTFGVAYANTELQTSNCTITSTTPLIIINGVGYFAGNVKVTGSNPTITLPIDVQQITVLTIQLEDGTIGTATSDTTGTVKINTNKTGTHYIAGYIATSC